MISKHQIKLQNTQVYSKLLLHLQETDKDISTWTLYKEACIAWYDKHLKIGNIGKTANQGGYTPAYSAKEEDETEKAILELVQEMQALRCEVHDLKESNNSEDAIAQKDFINQVLGKQDEQQEEKPTAEQEYWAWKLQEEKKRKFDHTAQAQYQQPYPSAAQTQYQQPYPNNTPGTQYMYNQPPTMLAPTANTEAPAGAPFSNAKKFYPNLYYC